MRIQHRSKRPRARLSSCTMHRIWMAVDREAKRWDVSRSFVINNALAYAFSIEIEEDYKKERRRG